MTKPGRLSILLIDDSAEDRGRVRRALIQGDPERRYRFLEAADALAGLALLETESEIDCVIVDIHMPRMTGLEFLKRLDDSTGLAKWPVIVLTGSSGKNDSIDALQHGAQDYVSKEAIYPAVLPRVVENAIERFRLNQQLVRSRQAAFAANQTKTVMIGNISHEIRTPMTAVLGLTELLLDSPLTDDQREMMEMVRDNSQYLVEIVNDLLDLSKMEAGMLEIDPLVVNVRSLIEDLVTLMQVRARQSGNRLQVEFQDDLPQLSLIDPVRLRQVLLNLLSNAIKFTEEGSVWLKVHCVRDADCDYLEFAVEDSGCGIPAEQLERVFEPFVQVGKSRNRNSGTGLGLAICRRLTNAMDGTLSVTSQMGIGSTFTVRIPSQRPMGDDIKRRSVGIVRTGAVAPNALAGIKVLVAEDTRATQFLLRHFLTGVEAQVTIVEDGQQLIDFVSQKPSDFDVIVTDVQMPNVDGLQAIRHIRAQGTTCPIIVLTADAVEQTRQESIAAGASEVVTKPIQRSTLISTILSLLNERLESAN